MFSSTLYLGVLFTVVYRLQQTIATAVIESNTTKATHTTLLFWDYDVHCKFQPDSFQCSKPENWHIRWYYDIKLQECTNFKHFRCKTNNLNIFKSYNECRENCLVPGPHVIDNVLPENAACHLQPDFGACQDYKPMFYFDISTRRCEGFAYSGCGGNQNRFYDQKSCADVCTDVIEDQ